MGSSFKKQLAKRLQKNAPWLAITADSIAVKDVKARVDAPGVTNFPSPAPTRAPTTEFPTAAPTPSPTKAPTLEYFHPCDDGSHGCDKGPGGICNTRGMTIEERAKDLTKNDWTCSCAAGFFAHTVALIPTSNTNAGSPFLPLHF